MTNDDDNDLIETNVDYFVTTTTFKGPIERVMKYVKKCKTNGDLCFHLVEGGVRRIELSERAPITDEESDEIRRILGMDEESS